MAGKGGLLVDGVKQLPFADKCIHVIWQVGNYNFDVAITVTVVSRHTACEDSVCCLRTGYNENNINKLIM